MSQSCAAHQDGFEGRKVEISLRMLLYKRQLLGQLTDAVALGWTAVNEYRPLLWCQQPRYAAQQGGLAAAVGTHDGDE